MNTDHSLVFPRYFDRIPLIIRFPGQEHKGSIAANTQRADIPATFLDFIGYSQPEWLDGSSLIRGDLEYSRPIITCYAANDMYFDHMQKYLRPSQHICNPHFFTLHKIDVIQGQKIFILDLYSLEYIQGEIIKHTAPLTQDALMNKEQALNYIITHLRENGYDTNTIQKDKIKQTRLRNT